VRAAAGDGGGMNGMKMADGNQANSRCDECGVELDASHLWSGTCTKPLINAPSARRARSTRPLRSHDLRGYDRHSYEPGGQGTRSDPTDGSTADTRAPSPHGRLAETSWLPNRSPARPATDSATRSDRVEPVKR